MHINLPDRIHAESLNEDLAMVIAILAESGVASVGEVRITLRAFNHDNREYYAPDEAGHHNMGFTLKRPASPGPSDIREISWTYREPKPQLEPPALGELRGLQSLLGPVPKRDE